LDIGDGLAALEGVDRHLAGRRPRLTSVPFELVVAESPSGDFMRDCRAF
jgi:hypothetical protein